MYPPKREICFIPFYQNVFQQFFYCSFFSPFYFLLPLMGSRITVPLPLNEFSHQIEIHSPPLLLTMKSQVSFLLWKLPLRCDWLLFPPKIINIIQYYRDKKGKLRMGHKEMYIPISIEWDKESHVLYNASI
ncbi:uncharacterized protein TM35_001341020 [Trypanosoma theileri]|uniref:Uncharacterized protein n=1 Tax=Trypanosoma theileri TaxID=67003 RepID=A0A1X0NDT8_9TRYP|nr:uncharacterized protein TM35_001341020 [Trypanosoma theileri]ORC81010.1 hypothetical protein TM35_001341020 [Trypanosoma theileri]